MAAMTMLARTLALGLLAVLSLAAATETCQFGTPDGSTCAIPGVKPVCCDVVHAAAECAKEVDKNGCMQGKVIAGGLLQKLMDAGFKPGMDMKEFCPALAAVKPEDKSKYCSGSTLLASGLEQRAEKVAASASACARWGPGSVPAPQATCDKGYPAAKCGVGGACCSCCGSSCVDLWSKMANSTKEQRAEMTLSALLASGLGEVPLMLSLAAATDAPVVESEVAPAVQDGAENAISELEEIEDEDDAASEIASAANTVGETVDEVLAEDAASTFPTAAYGLLAGSAMCFFVVAIVTLRRRRRNSEVLQPPLLA
jgi:hypothetical protein